MKPAHRRFADGHAFITLNKIIFQRFAEGKRKAWKRQQP
jgi:hypothetical protein